MKDDEDMEENALKAAYREAFRGEAGRLVLADLAGFCFDGGDACAPSTRDGRIDALMLAKISGRKEVIDHVRRYVLRGVFGDGSE